MKVEFEAYMATTVATLDDACTRCGRCVEVCPVRGEAGLDGAAAGAVVDGVFRALRGGEALAPDARAWMQHCNGCGECIDACPEEVNPRRALMFAQCHDARGGAGVDQVFRKLAQAVRLVAAMQLSPAEMARVFNHRPDGQTDVVFYTGCNALRTPHVLLNAMQILDALEVRYQVAGGPASCCGIAHTRTEGSIDTGGRVLESTAVRFEAMGARRVLSWCPSCQSQMDETWQGYRERQFTMEHVTGFLLEHADALAARFTTPVPRRVVLHAHTGYRDFGENVATLLRRIHGLELVDTVVESGYTCGLAGTARAPMLQAEDRGRLIEACGSGAVDAVVSLYHSCHRSLLADAAALAIPVVNFTDLIVEALGGEPAPDRFAGLAQLSPAAVASETAAYLEANGVELGAGWVEANVADLFSMAEYRGGLECLVSGAGARA